VYYYALWHAASIHIGIQPSSDLYLYLHASPFPAIGAPSDDDTTRSASEAQSDVSLERPPQCHEAPIKAARCDVFVPSAFDIF